MLQKVRQRPERPEARTYVAPCCKKYTPEEKNKCVEPRGKVQSRSQVAQQVAHLDAERAAELAIVTTAWADLSDDTRRAILATVRAAVAASE